MPPGLGDTATPPQNLSTLSSPSPAVQKMIIHISHALGAPQSNPRTSELGGLWAWEEKRLVSELPKMQHFR